METNVHNKCKFWLNALLRNSLTIRVKAPVVKRSKVTPYYTIGSLSVVQAREFSRSAIVQLVVGMLLNLMLLGCTVGPKYEPPFVEMPCEWHSSVGEEMPCDSPDCFLWWECFNDPLLNSLIERAALQNLDLSIAAMRILEARAEQKGGNASLLPHLDGSLSYGHAQYNQKTLNKILETSHHHHDSSKRNLNFFEIGFDADWEIDLFGRNKHEIMALKAKIESSEAEYCHLWVTLSAEVARNYIELRGWQQRLKVINQDIGAQKESLHLTDGLTQIGFTNTLDQRQAQEQLSALEAEKPQIKLSINKAIHRLSILLGYAPGDLFAELEEPGMLPCFPGFTPLGIPSELLRRRPDIRRAERDLAAATEQVGTAIAALFPRLSLQGFIGEIFTVGPSSFTWFASPQVLLPIFNSRLLKQDVTINKIKAQEALYEYQKTVLGALEEAENGIASLHSERERNFHLAEAYEASREAAALTHQLYQRGLKDYLAVLVTQRSLLAAESAYLQNQIELLFDYIALYKALGGGWDP